MASESVIEKLAEAFPPHPIDPAAAFEEWGGTYTDAERFRAGVRGRAWTELEATFLERHHDALVFFGPSSIADYLPAYLAALVRRAPALSAMPSFLLGVLARDQDPARFDERFARLTPAQHRAIAVALTAYEAELEEMSRQRDVTEVLDGA